MNRLKLKAFFWIAAALVIKPFVLLGSCWEWVVRQRAREMRWTALERGKDA